MVCGPATLIPKYLHTLGVKVEHNLRKALEWCDVANMLRIQLERQDSKFFPSIREYTMQYGLTLDLLNSLDKEIIVMHPGNRLHDAAISIPQASSISGYHFSRVRCAVFGNGDAGLTSDDTGHTAGP